MFLKFASNDERHLIILKMLFKLHTSKVSSNFLMSVGVYEHDSDNFVSILIFFFIICVLNHSKE